MIQVLTVITCVGDNWCKNISGDVDDVSKGGMTRSDRCACYIVNVPAKSFPPKVFPLFFPPKCSRLFSRQNFPTNFVPAIFTNVLCEPAKAGTILLIHY